MRQAHMQQLTELGPLPAAARIQRAPPSAGAKHPPMHLTSRSFFSIHDHWHRRQGAWRSEEHTSELQSLMRISYAVFCLKKKKNQTHTQQIQLRNNMHNHKHDLKHQKKNNRKN